MGTVIALLHVLHLLFHLHLLLRMASLTDAMLYYSQISYLSFEEGHSCQPTLIY